MATAIQEAMSEPLTAAGLTCELVQSFSRLQELSSDWERLWRNDSKAEVFQNFAWARAWWQAYGERLSLCTVVVSEGHRVIGIVPLARDGQTIVFIGGSQADYCDMVCEENKSAEVLSAALQELLQVPGWRNCCLQNLKPEGRVLSCWRTLLGRRFYPQVVPGQECKTILLEGNREIFDSLLAKDHTRRRLNKLRKAGSLTFRHIETKAEALTQLDQFFLHQIRRRAIAGKTSSSETPEFCQLLRNLVNGFDLTDSLRFGVLELNGRPLAWHFSFYANGKFLFYQQTFDIEAWDYAPGEVLIHELLRYGRENVSREFDFGSGNEPFKARFTTHVRRTYSMYVERPGFQGAMRYFLRFSAIPLLRIGQRVSDKAKHYPTTFRAFRSARLWLDGFLIRVRRKKQKETLMAWGQRAAEEFLHIAHLGKEEIGLFLLGDENEALTRDSNFSLATREAGFVDLVDLSYQCPEILAAVDLPRYKLRLKSGDRIFTVWQDERPALLAWVGTRRLDEVLPLATARLAPPSGPLMLLYEYWVLTDLPNPSQHCELLRAVSQEARRKNLALGVCCPQTSTLLRNELEHHGFQQRYRLMRKRMRRSFQINCVPLDRHSGRVQS